MLRMNYESSKAFILKPPAYLHTYARMEAKRAVVYVRQELLFDPPVPGSELAYYYGIILQH